MMDMPCSCQWDVNILEIEVSVNKIYICHQYGGDESNKQHIEQIIKALIKKESAYSLYMSPVHALGFLYNDVDYKTGITYCLELLKQCDVMYVFGKYSQSKGCTIEKQFCLMNNIKMQTIDLYDLLGHEYG